MKVFRPNIMSSADEVLPKKTPPPIPVKPNLSSLEPRKKHKLASLFEPVAADQLNAPTISPEKHDDINSGDSVQEMRSLLGTKTAEEAQLQSDEQNDHTQSNNLRIDTHISHDNHIESHQSQPDNLSHLLEEKLTKPCKDLSKKPFIPPKPKPRSRSSSGGSNFSLDIKDHVSSAPLVSPMDEKPEDKTELTQLSPPVPKPRRSLSMNDQFKINNPEASSCEDPPALPLRPRRHESQRTESPKRIVRRPSEPPPLPPDFPMVPATKKLIPTRPPPPVPSSASPHTSPGLFRASSTSRSNAAVVVMTTQPHPPLTEIPSETAESEQVYATIDEDAELDSSEQISTQRDSSSETVEHLPRVSIEPPTPDADDIYTEPDSEPWPSTDAPGPPGGTLITTTGTSSKTDTLRSGDSNIYEDLDSSSDDQSDGHSINDFYSDNLDETLESDNQKSKRESSSESEEEEDTDEKRQEKSRKLYAAAEEIVVTEEEFTDKLKLLNIDFRMHISEAVEESGEPIIPASCMNNILRHLPQLTNINEELLKDLKTRIAQWDVNPKIADIFIKIGPFLKMYKNYMKDFQTMNKELEDAVHTYPLFAEKLKEFEKSPRCKNLKLTHYMLKPVQRIPQYKLMLTQYQKYLTPDSLDAKDIHIALAIVSEAADHANEAMKEVESFHTLLELQNSLVGDFKVLEPGRVKLKDGVLYKQSRKELQIRALFLFNDQLVITVPQPGGYYKVKYVLPLDDMKISRSMKEDFQKEFTIVSKKRSFVAVTNTVKDRDAWVRAIEDAIKDRESKMRTYNNQRMTQTGSREYVLGETAPVWIADDRVTMCMLCNETFTFSYRRHHCRACGKVICGPCSEYKAPIKYDDYKSKRVCYVCYQKLYQALVDNEAQSLPDTPSKSDLKTKFRSKAVKDNSHSKSNIPKVLAEVRANDPGSFSGSLSVFMPKRKQWKKFWFVLKDKVLYKYNASEDSAAIESKPLLGYKVTPVASAHDGFDQSLLFRLHHPQSDIIEPILFRADNGKVAAEWIERMSESTST